MQNNYQQQEYVETLLLNEICQRNIWDKAATDKKGLAAFYAKNKKKYKWELKRLKKMNRKKRFVQRKSVRKKLQKKNKNAIKSNF